MPGCTVASTTPDLPARRTPRRLPRCETVHVPKPNRPTVVELMAEHADAYLWNRSPDQHLDDDYVVDPAVLGLSHQLIARLDEWNVEWSCRVLGFGNNSGAADWERNGLRLAYRLQAELDALGLDIDVRYGHDDDPRPLRERRGR